MQSGIPVQPSNIVEADSDGLDIPPSIRIICVIITSQKENTGNIYVLVEPAVVEPVVGSMDLDLPDVDEDSEFLDMQRV